MPRPVPLPIRQAIYHRVLQDSDTTAIAEELRLPVRTVRHLVHKFRQDGTKLAPNYARKESVPSPSVPPLIEAALAMRAAHAGWGAGLIRVLLAEDHPSEVIPSERTIRRWLSHLGSKPAAAGRRATTNANRANHPHEVWQMDAADQKRLKTGQLISWLRVADECSGAVLQTVVFSRGILQSGGSHSSAGGFERHVQDLGITRTVPSR